MEKKLCNYIKYLLSYLYIVIGYSCIFYFIAYYIRVEDEPFGWMIRQCEGLLLFIAYAAINHILMRKVISNKLLIIIETLLFVSMLTLIISDLRYEEYIHFKYIQSALPVKVTPGPGY